MIKKHGPYGDKIDPVARCSGCGGKCPHVYAMFFGQKYCCRDCFEKAVSENRKRTTG